MRKILFIILCLLLTTSSYGADTKVSALTDLGTTPAATDQLYINDGGTSKRVDYSDVMAGNAGTATALAANGADCAAGSYPLGVDASGAVANCTDATTEINSVVNGLGGTNLTCAAQSCDVDDAFLVNNANDSTSGVLTSTGFTIGSAAIIEAELETIDGVTAGTAAASKAVVLDASKDIAIINVLTATSLVGALTGNASTATALAANGANCSVATQFAVGTNASGVAECEAIADADVPDDITITNNVTAGAVITDNALVRGDGGAKGVQEISTWTITDAGNMVTSFDYAGLGGLFLTNSNDDAISIAGPLLRISNDLGYYGSLSMASSASTFLTNSFQNALVLYNTGQANTAFVVDGNEDFVWYTDPTDAHDYTGFSNAVMTLEADGDLDVSGTINSTGYNLNGAALALTGLSDVNSATVTAGNLLVANGSDFDSVALSSFGGRSITSDADSIDADAELYTDQMGVRIETPAVEDLDKIFYTMNAITVTRVWCITDAGTTTINIENDSGTDILSSDLICDVGEQTSCASGCDVDTIQLAQDNIAAFNNANISISATATATVATVYIGFTIDD